MWWIIFFHRIHRFHRISYIILPQKLMRWIFVRNAVNFAVNFCKKCGEMRWIIYFHRIHRNHRISYKISPHSPHFLQKITLKPRPGRNSAKHNRIMARDLGCYKIHWRATKKPKPRHQQLIAHLFHQQLGNHLRRHSISPCALWPPEPRMAWDSWVCHLGPPLSDLIHEPQLGWSTADLLRWNPEARDIFGIFSVCAPPPQLSGCILFATPRRTCSFLTY